MTKVTSILFAAQRTPLFQNIKYGHVLTRPKSGRLFLEDRSVLINCPVNYVDNGEFDKASDENKSDEFILTKIRGSQIKVQ